MVWMSKPVFTARSKMNLGEIETALSQLDELDAEQQLVTIERIIDSLEELVS